MAPRKLYMCGEHGTKLAEPGDCEECDAIYALPDYQRESAADAQDRRDCEREIADDIRLAMRRDAEEGFGC